LSVVFVFFCFFDGLRDIDVGVVKDSPQDLYASFKSDVDCSLRWQTLLCSWTLCLEQSADGPRSSRLVILVLRF